MHYTKQALSLISSLVKANLFEEALVLAQALQITEIRDINLVTPNSPLYPVFQKVLHPEKLIEDKLSNFSTRLQME